jgi:UDP-N-acetylmuramoyl-tripeptide--D-alanyl-D-alanine ligase
VTGSAGKTTTKDMTAAVLSRRFNTLKSDCNHNNEIGHPYSVLKLNGLHEAAVFELGMNHLGEIRVLADVSRPTVSVITNIGTAHIENLGSRDGIYRAKTEILEFNPKQIIVNGADDKLIQLKDRENVTFFGTDVYASDIGKMDLDGVRFTVNGRHGAYPVHIRHPIGGAVENALAAAAVGEHLGLSPDEIRAGLAAFEPSGMRMEIIRTEYGLTVLNDAYNANPEAMKETISFLAGLENRYKVLIMGDMFELGEHSEAAHSAVGEFAAVSCLDRLIFIGAHSVHAFKRANELHNNAEWYCDKQSFIDNMPRFEAGSVILVKGSRGMALEEIVKLWTEH